MIINIIALVVLLIFIIAALYYAGLKIFNFIKLLNPKVNKILFFVLSTIFFILLIASEIFRYKEPLTIEYILSLIGGYYAFLIIYIIMFYLVFDIIKLIFIKAMKIDLSKKTLMGVNIFIIVSIIVIIIIGSYNANKTIIKKYSVILDKNCNDKELNIVMVSDIHLGYVIGNKSVENMVNKINTLKPDIVLIGGDIMNGDFTPVKSQNMGRQLLKIKSKYGVYAVLGNHDDVMDANKLDRYYEGLNIKLLRDDVSEISNRFYIIGRNDASSERINKRKSILELEKNIDMSKPVILLDHQPNKLYEAANDNIDLQLSGHTHSGQFFPFSMGTYFMYKDSYGFAKIKNTNVIVSCGYGTWGPNIRLGSRSEIVQVKLKCK